MNYVAGHHTGVLHIKWQLQRLSPDGRGGYRRGSYEHVIQVYLGYHLVPTKSKAGVRHVPITPWMASALLELRQAQGPTIL